MVVIPNPNYNQTITIYNCLKGVDNATGKDLWYKTLLENCFYKSVLVLQPVNNTTAKMVNAYTVRIPESDKYKSYSKWVKLPHEERVKYFTVRMDDLVIKGSSAEGITGESPDTLAQVLTRNKPDAFKVSAFADNTLSAFGKHYRLGG